jgi:hypothetical protein
VAPELKVAPQQVAPPLVAPQVVVPQLVVPQLVVPQQVEALQRSRLLSLLKKIQCQLPFCLFYYGDVLD